jgi:hypothetical protein
MKSFKIISFSSLRCTVHYCYLSSPYCTVTHQLLVTTILLFYQINFFLNSTYKLVQCFLSGPGLFYLTKWSSGMLKIPEFYYFMVNSIPCVYVPYFLKSIHQLMDTYIISWLWWIVLQRIGECKWFFDILISFPLNI